MPRKKKKRIIILSVLLGLLSVLALFKIAKDMSGVPGKLYQYYPASTGFYVELAPGEKLTRRFVAFLDSQAAAVEHQEKARQEALKQTEVKQPNALKNDTTPPVLEKKNLPVQSKTPAEKAVAPQPVQTELSPVAPPQNFRRIFLRKFNSTFEPYLSLGIWPDPALAGTGLPTTSGHTLVVLPLKENLRLSEVIHRFDLDAKDFKQGVYRGQPYLEETHSGTSMAILNQKLLISNHRRAMESALSHYQKHAPHVYDEPANKTYLSQLPWFRQGTFLLNNAVYTSKAMRKNNSLVPKVASLGDILPLTVGAIQAQPEQYVTLRFITPIQFNNIPDFSFRKSLQAVVQPPTSFPQASQLPEDTGVMVSATGLDKIYDFYHDFMMPPENTRWLQMLHIVLSGFHVDFRNDIIGLLSHRSVIASRLQEPVSLRLIVDKTEAKDKSLNRISTLLSTNVFPIKLKKTQVGAVSTQTLSLPVASPEQAASQIEYGTLGSSLVFATPQDFQAIVRATAHQKPSLTETAAYRSIMTGLPAQNNALIYVNVAGQKHFSKLPPGMQHPSQWLDTLGLALWFTTVQQKEMPNVTVLNGQINLKLVSAKK